MSLLMDALKRAEQAKREQGQDRASSAPAEMQLEPVSPAERPDKQANSVLPDLHSHLDSVEADLKATAAEPPPRGSTPRRNDNGASRAAAQNVFAAATASPPGNEPKGGSASRIAAIIGVGVLAAGALGGYFYWQLQAIAQNGNRLVAPGLAAVPARGPLPPPAPIAEAVPAAAPQTAAPAATAESAAASAPGSPSAAMAKEPARRRGTASLADAEQTATRRPQGGSPSGSKPQGSKPALGEPLKVSSQSQESLVMQGYNALQASRFAEAKAAYTQALRADPRDPDALLGLAALTRHDGDPGLAGDYYERVLRSDPRNAAAHAGLIALQGGGDAAQAESRLKSLASSQNSDANATAALNFALGNLYSAQRRWPEAQQAYFNSYSADSTNPDTLYNLAISLEHLNQPALARQFYEQALTAGRQRSAAFDRSQAEQRLATLAR